MYAPVVVFVYKRLEHTKKTLDSLMKNELCSKTDVFIFSDGYKGSNDKDDVLSVRKYIHSLEGNNPFKSLCITESSKNNGLAASVISGTTKVIEKYGRVIVIEDDLLLSEHYLKYMNGALDFYESERRVWSIGSHSGKMKFMETYNDDVFFCHRASSWGWGTWLDRWKTVDWDVADYSLFKTNLKERKKFNLGGDDMASLLDRQMCGLKDSWAIRWCYAQYKDGSYCVRPVEPVIINIGQDGSGTHCTVNRYSDAAMSSKTEWSYPEFFDNAQIEKEFANIHHTSRIKLFGSFVLFALLKGKLYKER